jgi:hypothetical protein
MPVKPAPLPVKDVASTTPFDDIVTLEATLIVLVTFKVSLIETVPKEFAKRSTTVSPVQYWTVWAP